MKRIGLLGAAGWVLGMWTALLSVLVDAPLMLHIGVVLVSAGCVFMVAEVISMDRNKVVDRKPGKL
jgi:hypothetical protein